EVASEPPAPEEAQIVYRDDDILVVDKPHGMPVTPSGQHVERSLFVRLQRSTGLPDLAPMHRLDRETAGLVLFAIKPAARTVYHRMFAEGNVEREYFDLAQMYMPVEKSHWRYGHRIVRGRPGCR